MLGNIPIRPECAEETLRNLKCSPGLTLGHILVREISWRHMVDEPPEHPLAEGCVILRVGKELMPRGIDRIRRTADTRTGPAEVEELLQVDEELFCLLMVQAELGLETLDEFGILVAKDLFDQSGVAAVGLQFRLNVHCYLMRLEVRFPRNTRSFS